MYRVIKMSEIFYAIQVELYDDLDNIEYSVDGGDIVILCEDLNDLAEMLGINADEIRIIKPD